MRAPTPIKVRQVDAAGNNGAAASFSFTLDTTPPAAPTVALASDTGSSGSDHITSNGLLTVTPAEAGGTIQYSTDGGINWTGSFAAVEGANAVKVRQVDAAGNNGAAASFSFTLDTTPPAAPTVALASDTGSSGSDHITSNGLLTVTPAEAGGTIQYSTDGGINWTGSFAAVEGANAVKVRQVDAAGNNGAAASFSFTLDTTPPAAPTVALASDTGSSGSDHITSNGLLTVTPAEAGGTIQYSTDGGINWTGSFAAVEGANAVKVRQVDAAGNNGAAASFSFTLDTTPPAAPAITTTAPAQDTAASINISGTAEANSSIALYNKGTALIGGTATADGTGHWSVSGIALTNGADYSFTAKATDAAGNTSGASNALAFHDNQTVPSILIAAIAGDNTINAAEAATGFLISGTTSNVEDGQTATIQIVDGSNIMVDSFTATVTGNAWSVTVPSTDHLADGSYTVKADVSDLAGTAAIEATQVITVDEAAPAAPTVALASDTGSSGSDHITSNGLLTVTPAEAGGTIQYSTDGGINWTGSFAAVEGANAIKVRQVDAAGNNGAAASFSFTLDTTPPAAPTVALASDTGSSGSDHITSNGLLTVTPAEAGGTIQYSTDGGINWTGSFAAVEGANAIKVRQVDAAGNNGAAASFSFTLDTTPPAAPTVALASDTGSSGSDHITSNGLLTVTPAEAGGTIQYSTDGGINWTGSFAAVEGANAVKVRQVDAAGNNGAAASFSFTLDTTPPAAPAITTTAPAQDTAASINISGTAEANSSIALYNKGTALIGGTATADGTGHWSVSGIALTNGADYSFTAKATDAAGNTSGASNALAFHDNQSAVVITTIVTPNGYDLHGMYGDIAGSSGSAPGATHDATHFDAINAGTGHTFHLIGTGFTYGVDGFTGGTVTEIDILNTANSATLVTMIGFAIDAVALNNAVGALQGSSDPSQLSALFNQYSYDSTGGSGNDTLLAFANADAFDGGGGLNTVDYVHYGSGITADLADPSQNTGNAAGDSYSNITGLIGTNYNDTLIGDANNNGLEGGAGADTLIGGGGALNFASYFHAGIGITADLADPSQNTGDAAGDIYIGINSLIGSNFVDTLIGDNNDNYLRGRGGGDVLNGGGGSDTADYARGGAVRADLSNPATNTGDAAGDTYISIENLRGSDFNDVLVGDAGNNTLDGGLGVDQTIYTAATGGITVDMAAGTVSGPGVGNDTLVSIESIRGSAFADTYVATGYTGASAFGSVTATYNEFEGMAGDDIITGNGTTALSYLHATSGVTVDIAAGIATGDASVGTDTFTGVRIVRGSAFDDTLRGSNNPNVELFEGDAGNDFIDGRGGFDRVTYSPQLDNSVTGGITVNLAAGTVVGDASVGTDTLRSIEAVRATNFADIYNATGFTTTSINGPNFGSAGFIVFGGVQQAFNEFEGMGGNDSITGNGNTRISYINATAGVTVDLAFTTVSGSTGIAHATATDAGIGTDTIFGGVNAIIGSGFADMLYGSNNAGFPTETFDGGAGNDTIDGRGGFDLAVYNADNGTASGIIVDMLAGTVAGDASIGTDTLISIELVRGTNFADTYVATGFSGASTDTGLAATFNEFEGMAGNDTITGNGNTRISYVSATGGVSVDLAAGTATGDASVGTDTFTGVNRARGSNFDDTISGDANNNILEGQGGNDVLFGRGGNDTLTGGTGSDQFFYSSGADTITDFDRSSGSFNHTEGDTIDLAGSGVTTWAQLQSDRNEPERREYADRFRRRQHHDA